ncbi:MAG: SsgA family sporulation/cell division regulator [Frankiaceae bacterium]
MTGRRPEPDRDDQDERSAAGTVVHATAGTLAVNGIAVAIDVLLGYDGTDPYAVDLVASYGEFQASWLLPRTVLLTGMRRTVDTRAIKVRPRIDAEGRRYVAITLLSRHAGTIHLGQEGLERFLTETAAIVPVGRETAAMDVDAGLMRLLTGEP